MDINNSLINKASEFAKELLLTKLPPWALYHNLNHTIETVETCYEISEGLKLNNYDTEILTIAAWFHDAGYTETSDGHEEVSVKIASNFLIKYNYPVEKMNKVSRCILATKISNQPNSFLEEVICDADMIVLGKKEFFERNDLLKLEIENRDGVNISETTWLKRSLEFISKHIFYTEYAKLKFNQQLLTNIKILKKMIEPEI